MRETLTASIPTQALAPPAASSAAAALRPTQSASAQPHTCGNALDYTGHITRLMADIILRVPRLGFIDLRDVLVFARPGRLGTDGPYASCHCLTLPESEPGYFFWRDRQTGAVTRRSEWFVTRSPRVEYQGRHVSYLISFSLPRFCNQALAHSRKRELYAGDTASWVAKLDTIVHELYHIDPSGKGLRGFARADGRPTHAVHGPRFFQEVSMMVREYLASRPDPALLEFLRDDFVALQAHYGGVTGLTFRQYPSYPRRYRHALSPQPPSVHLEHVKIELVVKPTTTTYSDADVQTRMFLATGTRVVRPPATIAAA